MRTLSRLTRCPADVGRGPCVRCRRVIKRTSRVRTFITRPLPSRALVLLLLLLLAAASSFILAVFVVVIIYSLTACMSPALRRACARSHFSLPPAIVHALYGQTDGGNDSLPVTWLPYKCFPRLEVVGCAE